MFRFLSSFAKRFFTPDEKPDPFPAGPARIIDTSRPGNRQREDPPVPTNLAQLDNLLATWDRRDRIDNEQ